MFMSEVTSTILQPGGYYQPPRHQSDHFHRNHNPPPAFGNDCDVEKTSNGPVKYYSMTGSRKTSADAKRIQRWRDIEKNEQQAKREAAVSNANDYSKIISNVARMTESAKPQRAAINKNGYRFKGPKGNHLPNEELESRGSKEALARQGRWNYATFFFEFVNYIFSL